MKGRREDEMNHAQGSADNHPETPTIIPSPGLRTRPPLVLVTCAGRSGSKWMLKMLNFHPQTLCRNEPNREGMDPGLADPDATNWEQRAMDSGAKIGFIDLAPDCVKDYARGWVKLTRADKLLYSRRVQNMTGRYPEAGYPWFMFNPSKVGDAQRVMKIINARYLICKILEETDHIPVIHLIRHPGGMLSSWLTRYVPEQNQNALLVKQRGILARIHEREPDFKQISGPVEGKDLAELKIWCWRHAQEHMLTLGALHPRYLQVTFEKLSQRPVEIMEPIYALCGLEYTESIKARIEHETSASPEIASAWKNKLSSEHQDLIERVLNGSVVEQYL
jgi:hypothetical protein